MSGLLLFVVGVPVVLVFSAVLSMAGLGAAFISIVVGHRGLSPIKAFLLGSVSDRVVSHAPCSVLVVRPALEAKR